VVKSGEELNLLSASLLKIKTKNFALWAKSAGQDNRAGEFARP